MAWTRAKTRVVVLLFLLLVLLSSLLGSLLPHKKGKKRHAHAHGTVAVNVKDGAKDKQIQPTEPEYGVPQEQLDGSMEGGDFLIPGKNTAGRTPSPSRSAGKQDTTSSTIAGWFTRSPSPSPSLPSSSSSSSSSGSASPRTLPPAVHSQLSPPAAAGPQKQQTPQTIPNQQQHIMGVGTSLLPQRPSSIAGLSTCFPMSGAELEAMIRGDTCTVAILTKSSLDDYKIREMMLVRSPKVIVGNPIDMPVINATNRIERLFDVLPGGYLDLRAVQLYGGGGRAYDNGTLRVIQGGAIRVHLGGNFIGWAVVFRVPRQTLDSFLRDISDIRNRRRVFGGHVLVIGGQFTCFGCQTVRFYPFGNPVINTIQVGANYLVLGGSLLCVGCYSVIATMYSSSVNIGNLGATFLGSLSFIGGGVTGAGVVIGQFVAGGNTFVAGGVMVNVGLADVGAFMGAVRAGFGQYSVCGGQFVKVGQMEVRAWGVGAAFGAGQTYAMGGGNQQVIGAGIVTYQISLMQALAGGNTFVGAGNVGFHGVQYVTFGLTFSQNGVGLRQAILSGSHELIGSTAVALALARVLFGLGTEAYLGTGFLTLVGDRRYSYIMVSAVFGGHEYFVAAGAAVMIDVISRAGRLLNYRTNRNTWWISGPVQAGGYTDPIAWNPYEGANTYCDFSGCYALTPDGPVPLTFTGSVFRRLQLPPGFNTTAYQQWIANGSAQATLIKKGPQKYARDVKPKRSSIVMIQGKSETVKAQPPGRHLFQAALNRVRRRQLQESDEVPQYLGGLDAWSLTDLWTEVLGEMEGADQQAAPQETERWPEYVYARGSTDCFICGMEPLPSSQFIPPDGEPGDTAWAKTNSTPPWIASTVVDRGLSAADGEPANRRPVADGGRGYEKGHDGLFSSWRRQAADGAPSAGGSDADRGRSTCVSSDACVSEDGQPMSTGDAIHAAQAASSTPLQLTPATRAKVRQEKEGLPDLRLVWFDATVYCQDSAKNGGCGISPQSFEAAVKHMLDEDYRSHPPLDKRSNGAETPPLEYTITASSGDLPAFVIKTLGEMDAYVQSNAEAPIVFGDQCTSFSRFSVYLTSPHNSSAVFLRQELRELAVDATPLYDELVSQLGENAAARQLCGVTVRRKGDVFLPSLDKNKSPESKRRANQVYRSQYMSSRGSMSSLWPTVRLFHDDELVEVTTAYSDNTYTITLGNFNVKGEVQVFLMKGLSRKSQTLLGSVTNTQDGPKQMTWTAPLVPTGDGGVASRYYLLAQVQAMPGVFAFSQPFTIATSARRRV